MLSTTRTKSAAFLFVAFALLTLRHSSGLPVAFLHIRGPTTNLAGIAGYLGEQQHGLVHTFTRHDETRPLMFQCARVPATHLERTHLRPPLRPARHALHMTTSQDKQPDEQSALSARYDEREKKIQLMVHMMARMGADLSSLGPAGDNIALVEELLGRLEALQREVDAAKESSISKRLLEIEPNISSKAKDGSLKLHVGCGKNTLEGWLNVDLHGWRLDEGGPSWSKNRESQRVLSLNVATTPLPLPDQSCQAVYCSHMLEHLSHPFETRMFLRDVHRVLAPGGVVRLVVPDAEKWLSAYVHKDQKFFDAVKKEWSFWNWDLLSSSGAPLDFVLPYLGASGLQGSISGGHQFGFDEGSLSALLTSAGFDRDAIRRCQFQGSRRAELRVDHTSSAAGAVWCDDGDSDTDRHFSLFMEGEKGADRSAKQRDQQLNLLQRMLRSR